jgi:hypothetical protein
MVATIFEVTSVHDLAKKCTVIDNRLQPLKKKKAATPAGAGTKSSTSRTGTTTKPAIPNDTQGAGVAAQSGGTGGARPARPAWTEERKKEYDLGVCFSCKKSGHLSRDCPTKATRAKVSEIADGESEETLN